jgi:hypothetical protein
MPESAIMARHDRGEALLFPSLILDLPLLLSPFGPWLTEHLSQHHEVWLVRSLVMLLEGDGLPLDAVAAAEFEPAIALWKRCWPEMVQRPRVHWLSDALDMSHAPKGEPPALLDRFDALIAALDGKFPPFPTESMPEGHYLWLEGAHHALALAAALRNPSVILTAFDHGGAEPWVCRALDRLGLTSRRLSDDEPLREVLAGPLLRGFARAGLAPLLGGGVLRLAALHLAAPGCSVPLPPARPAVGATLHGEPDEDALASVFEEALEDALWPHTLAIWHGVP